MSRCLTQKYWLAISALVVALMSTPSMAIVGTFTGGDPGDGLDFQGNFLYAVNVRGPGGFAIGNANFTTDQGGATPGFTHNAGSEILNWANPSFGASTNDNNLETVMQSIRHGAPGNMYQVNLANLTVGQDYKVQLLYTESCCDRGFDVKVNGALVADQFNIQATQGGINGNPTNGAVVTHSFTAFSNTATIVLDGPGAGFPDPNPTLSGLTLETLDTSKSFSGNVAFGKPASATSVYSAQFAPSKAVDGVTNDAQGFQWLAADGVTSASLTIDLQGSFDVTSFELLNTGNAGFLDRATGTFSIDVAGPDNVFQQIISPRALQFFTAGFQTELASVRGVSFVRFNMLSITDPDGGGPFPLAGGGLNEIRVNGTFSIPEPGTAVLGLLSLVGLASRRRRTA